MGLGGPLGGLISDKYARIDASGGRGLIRAQVWVESRIYDPTSTVFPLVHPHRF